MLISIELTPSGTRMMTWYTLFGSATQRDGGKLFSNCYDADEVIESNAEIYRDGVTIYSRST